MKRKPRTIKEMRDTRVKTTFKVEVTIDLPYFHNHDYQKSKCTAANYKAYYSGSS